MVVIKKITSQCEPAMVCEGSTGKRFAGADIARAVGVLAVVALHVSGYLTGTRGTFPDNVPMVAVLFQASFKFAVPLFVMVSGALLLGNRAETGGAFIRKRLNRILIPLVFWTAAYSLFSIYFRKDTLADLAIVVDQIARGRVYVHMYFLWLILGLYLLTPYLRVWVSALSRRELAQLTMLILAGTMFDQGLRQWFGIDYSPTVASWFAQFLGYYLLGYLLRPVVLGHRLRTVTALFIAATVGTAVLWWTMPLFTTRATGWPGSLFSPLVVVASAAVFLICAELGETWAPAQPRVMRYVRRMSELSFGIFLVHPMLVAVMYTYVPIETAATSPLAWCTVATLAVTLASFLITALAHFVPGLGMLVGKSRLSSGPRSTPLMEQASDAA